MNELTLCVYDFDISKNELLMSFGSFILSFSNNAPDPERDSASFEVFLAKMEADFRAHPLWVACSEDELESAGEVSYLFGF